MKFGVIADIQNMQTLFEQFIKKSKGAKHALQSGDFCIAVPTDITEVEKLYFLRTSAQIFSSSRFPPIGTSRLITIPPNDNTEISVVSAPKSTILQILN